MSSPDSLTLESGSNERWKFFRDVLVFQLKMFLDNVRDFALMPVSPEEIGSYTTLIGSDSVITRVSKR